MYAWSYQIFSKRKRRGRAYHTCSCWAMLVRRQGVWRTCAPAWSLVVAPGNACAWIWWLPSTWSSSGSRLPNKSDSMDMMQFAKPIEHSMDQGRTSSRHLSYHRTLNPFQGKNSQGEIESNRTLSPCLSQIRTLATIIPQNPEQSPIQSIRIPTLKSMTISPWP